MLVDLFSGCGGFSLGAHAAGFKVGAAFDIDPILTSSYAANFPGTQLVPADLSAVSGDDIIRAVGERPSGVFGGPPCQGFSDIGRRVAEDPRRALLGHFFRIVGEIQPDFFVMENVVGLSYSDALPLLQASLEPLARDYQILGPIILDAADFGAATKRRRLFVIGTRTDVCDPVAESDLTSLTRKSATVRDALSDLNDPAACEMANGFDWWKITKRGRPTDYAQKLRARDLRFTSHRKVEHRQEIAARFATVPQGGVDAVGRHPRLSWTGQCPTLRAGTGADRGSYQAVRPLHPEEHRVITVREAARLQGFPDRHLFHPTTWHSFRMIGNSVSPIISTALFRVVASKIEGAVSAKIAAE